MCWPIKQVGSFFFLMVAFISKTKNKIQIKRNSIRNPNSKQYEKCKQERGYTVKKMVWLNERDAPACQGKKPHTNF